MLLKILWCHVFILLPNFTYSASSFRYLNTKNEDTSKYETCVCVPFWLCKEDFSGLIEDGVDTQDIRLVTNSLNETRKPCSGDYDVCCRVECGKRRSISEADTRPFDSEEEDVFGFRILGENNEAEFGEFPWMLGILYDKLYRCGASLIHPNVAVTAAHCVEEEGPYKVRAGEWDWESTKELLPHQDRMTKKVIIHPHYHQGSLANDIALLILETGFRLTEHVSIACLPKEHNLIFDHRKCVASGWGKNSYKKNTYQSKLKKVELSLVPYGRCVISLQEAGLGPTFNLHPSFICAGDQGNKDTCKGDGGSPLVCPIEDQPGRFEQVGIVSWGFTCGVYNTPGVYVNLALYNDWIDSQMMKHNFNTEIYRY